MAKSFKIIVALSVCLLTACTDVAVTSMQAFYGRRDLEKNFTDQYITLQTYKSLKRKTEEFKNANIVIATLHREVLLAGQVPEAWQKRKAYLIATAIPNVEKVYNLIDVASPSSTATRLSDSWITAKIKAKYIANNDLDASQIKVVTENGTVYLMGIVMPEEADIAIDLARTTSGVQRVVKIFSYMHVDKNYKEVKKTS